MSRIAIFASGNGSNAENIIRYSLSHTDSEIEVVCVLYDRVGAGVCSKVRSLSLPTVYVSPDQWKDSEYVLSLLHSYQVERIVLAGFLRLVPQYLLDAYPERIINIHPSLLPKYGGKGMYGMHVHRAVKQNGESETGITIHLVDQEYDKGRILVRAKVGVLPSDTPEDIAERVHRLEYRYYPLAIAEWISLPPSP